MHCSKLPKLLALPMLIALLGQAHATSYALQQPAPGMQAVTQAPVTIKTLVSSAGGRTWSDGTYATSCLAYKTGDASHNYSGAVGDGLYRVSPGGLPTTVYCDMTNGGWTLVLLGTQSVGVAGWYAATGNYNVPASPDPSAAATWKYADSFINALPKTVYKLVSFSGYPGTYYTPGACAYGHQTPATAANQCGLVYANESLTTLLQTGTGTASGISDAGGSSGYHILTNNLATYASFGWCAGTGTAPSGGCGAAGTPTSIRMWVK